MVTHVPRSALFFELDETPVRRPEKDPPSSRLGSAPERPIPGRACHGQSRATQPPSLWCANFVSSVCRPLRFLLTEQVLAPPIDDAVDLAP